MAYQVEVEQSAPAAIRDESIVDLVTVVLPCLNEQDSVGLVVREAIESLASSGIHGEVLVVDNGSTDRSVQVALAAGARVIHEHRRGYGRAIRTGIAAATGSIVVMADADWTYDMTKLPSLIDPIRHGVADIAVGARLHEANRESMPVLHKYLGTPALTAIIRGAGGYDKLTDSQSGYRCFRKDTISRLGLRADGMEITSEMLLKSSSHRLRLIEVPTGYRKRIGVSKLNTFADGWRNLRVLASHAPEMFFLVPGAGVLLLGAALTITDLLPARGIEIGSFRWQPVFFASIALILGLQTTLVGVVFAWRKSSVEGHELRRSVRLIAAPSFPAVCSIASVVLLAVGFALDAVLFARWLAGSGTGIADLPIASLAQSLLLMGGTLGSFGLIVRWLHWDQHQRQHKD